MQYVSGIKRVNIELNTFTYGPEHQRVRQSVTLSGNGTSSYFAGNTWYLNGEDSLGLTYEKEVRANGTTENKHYLSAGGMVFAQFTSRSGKLNGLASTTTSYFQHDQLGSIVAITDAAGVVKERLAYDPWGKRRNIMTAPGTPDTLDKLVGKYTERGFTEHEHLDEIGVIHMNGRIYDPLMGRFMSADPVIEAAGQLASFNRYSYVWNNPLNRADPSGFCWICDPIGETTKTLNHVGDVIATDAAARTLVTVAIAYYTGQWVGGPISSGGLGMGAIWGGAAGGAAASAFASNGDINAIALGAVTGAGFGWAGRYGLWGQMVGGGVNGYLQTGTLQGFGRGLIAGAIPQDLGLTDSYMKYALTNIGIGIVRDGIRGSIVQGNIRGFWPGVVYGQTTNLIGHMVGFGTTLSAPRFRDGVFYYEGSLYGDLAKGGSGLTIGNVISGPEGLIEDSNSLLYLHENNHISNPVEQSFGALYIPAHIVDLAAGHLIRTLGGGCSGFAIEEHVQEHPYSVINSGFCK